MISSVLAVKNIVQCVIYFALFTILFVETTCTALAFIKKIFSWAVAAHAWIKFFVGKWGQSNVTNLFAGVGWGRVHGLFVILFFCRILRNKWRGWTPHFDHSTNPANDDVDTKANLAPATAEGEGKQLNFVCYNKNTIISMTWNANVNLHENGLTPDCA